MWVVNQADDPLSVLALNQTKGLDSRSPTRPEVGEERTVREKPERQLAKEPRGAVGKGTQRGSVGKGTQRGSVGEERRRETVENRQQKGPVKMS